MGEPYSSSSTVSGSSCLGKTKLEGGSMDVGSIGREESAVFFVGLIQKFLKGRRK
ncbi:hypothetical protein MTR_7g087900 [Medicago truncatula]|uniref:Uncharacterized protein n=1 Tax=Medicago truncatula TaxID=3880 RepID=G7L3Q0_MEDTR|nr:hypothetical protein MTR_7g087900 [Medicago truncatula]